VASSADSEKKDAGVREERRAPSVALIVLAAGASTRMGRPKQLLPYRGHTLLRNAAAIAAASVCRPVLVVLGAYANQIQPEIDGLPVRPVMNERWAEGIGTSIQAGLGALSTDDQADNVQAVVLMLCDQPCVTAAVIDDLVTAYYASGREIIASEYGGTLGVPALFGRGYFAELATVSGEAGAKCIIAAHASDVVPVPFPMGMADIDTPEEYRQLQRAMSSAF